MRHLCTFISVAVRKEREIRGSLKVKAYTEIMFSCLKAFRASSTQKSLV